MNWYNKVLKVVVKEQVTIATFTVTALSGVLTWRYGFHHAFAWQNITPISAPELFERVIYSALVFVSIGAFLYWAKFYKWLHGVIVIGLEDRWLYRKVKAIIWGILMLVMYFWIVPTVVNILNFVVSLIYNLLNFAIYLFPPIGCAVIVTGLAGIFVLRKGNLHD